MHSNFQKLPKYSVSEKSGTEFKKEHTKQSILIALLFSILKWRKYEFWESLWVCGVLL